jgi:hypothetical protein
MTKSSTITLAADPIGLLDRLTDPNVPPTDDDIAALVEAVRVALRDRTTIDTALGAGGGWQRWVDERRANEVIAAARATMDDDDDSSERAQIERLQRDAEHYRSGRYPRDRERGVAGAPGDRLAFALLQLYGGKVPSYSTLVRRFRRVGDLNHATAESDGMAIRLRKPIESAPPTAAEQPEKLDEYIADVRLPELQRQSAELNRHLREVFEVHKFDIDWDWRPNDEANAVATLLGGRSVPIEETMPPGALHASLLRRRENLDKAIAQAHRIKARVEERREAERLATAQPELRAILRSLVRHARVVQREKRALIELEQRLGVNPAFGLPSSGYALLGPGLPGDEVDLMTDDLLKAGYISRKDLLDE